MKLNNEYKEEIDKFCNEYCTVDAKDILAKTKNNEKVIQIDEYKKRHRTWRPIAVSIACFLFMGTTVFAATGVWGDIFRNIFKDEVTAEIVDKGYLYEIGQSKEEDVFQVDLLAVAGDAETPLLVFDVYIHDEKLAKDNDKILMYAYVLGEEQYANELDNYGPCTAYGERDKDVSNLYHVSMIGPPVWMTRGEPVVVDVCEMILDLNNPNNEYGEWYDLNMEYRFTPPASIFYPVHYENYEEVKFTQGEIDYYLTSAEYGVYRTELRFQYDLEGTALLSDGAYYSTLEPELQNNWIKFVNKLSIVVDGQEYKVNEDNIGYTWCDIEGEVGKKYHCFINPYFPSIDYENATSIILKTQDISYTLK